MYGTCFLSLKIMLSRLVHVVMYILILHFYSCVISYCEINYLRANNCQLLFSAITHFSLPFPEMLMILC